MFFQPDIVNNSCFLNEDESRHCVRVLRHSPGDQIQVIDGKGVLYTCRITHADQKKTTFEVIDKKQSEPLDYSIHIAVAPTKNTDRIEWFVEKAVETGIDRITFLLCENSERKTINNDRMKRKMISALKQSENLFMPELSVMTGFMDFINLTAKDSQRFICHTIHGRERNLANAATKMGKYVVMIGPEGDFSDRELEIASQTGFETVSLGNSRLRTETAAFMACSILHTLNALM